MSAATSTANSYTLVLSCEQLRTAIRFVEVTIGPPGFAPVVDLRRERQDDGTPCGSTRFAGAGLDALAAVIDAARRGERGLIAEVPIRSGAIALMAHGINSIGIGLRDETGEPRGRGATVQGAELDRLEEALFLARTAAR